MSLTAFNRLRRLHQVEEMKPENIKKSIENTVISNTNETPKEVNNFEGAPLVPDEPNDRISGKRNKRR